MKKLHLLTVGLLLIISSFGFAQIVNPYNGKSITPDSSRQIKIHKGKEISSSRSKEIELHSSKQIDPYKSKEISPYKAKEIEVYKGKSIEINQGSDAQKRRIKNDASTQNSATSSSEATKEMKNSAPENKKELAVQNNSIEKLFGVWRTKIPGAVWETPSGLQGYNNLHVSAGASSGALEINKNGTYKWNSYGGKKGKWEKGDSEYPLILIDNVEKKKWKVGFDSKHSGGRDIIIWDGYVWYDGKK